ncbi:MAG TPA: hypothetical protein VF041_09240 [Gemmatimonadaceae bacterium]
MTSDLPRTAPTSISPPPSPPAARADLRAVEARLDVPDAEALRPRVARSGATADDEAFFRVLLAPLEARLVVFLDAMISVYRHVVAAQPIIHVPRSLDEDSEIIQRDAPVNLAQGPLDDMLELGGVQ